MSYSSFNLKISNIPILDVVDETVGVFGLPITAVLIIIVFTWFADLESIHTDLNWSFLHSLTKYIAPSLLVIVTVVRLFSNFQSRTWGYNLPGIPLQSIPLISSMIIFSIVIIILGKVLVEI